MHSPTLTRAGTSSRQAVCNENQRSTKRFRSHTAFVLVAAAALAAVGFATSQLRFQARSQLGCAVSVVARFEAKVGVHAQAVQVCRVGAERSFVVRLRLVIISVHLPSTQTEQRLAPPAAVVDRALSSSPGRR
jgi:hypothetical protein